MSTFTTRTTVDLDQQWVHDLLVTAFDAQYGGCNYWLNDLAAQDSESGQRLVCVTAGATYVTLHFERSAEPLTLFNGGQVFVHLGDPGDGTITRTVTLTGDHLETAWAQIVDTRPIRSDLVDQFARSMASGDLDIDADAADCLMQYALFGQVIYG